MRTQLFERCDATPALAQCQELVELVTAYLDAAQDTAARERFEQHLQRCDGCAAYLEELRVTVATITANGAALAPIMLDARESVGFANPATDSTGNTFITYNPGRYNGVLVLVPTAGGFEDIGWDDLGGMPSYYEGRHAYYNAELIGPGTDGRYTIRQYLHSCTPDCASGPTTIEDLLWNGADYVA